MEIVSNIALISINETLILQVVSFLIFLFLLNRIMIRPLQATMRERTEYIRNMESSVKQSDTELQDLKRQMDEEEQAAVREARAEREKRENIGSEEAGQIMAQTRKEIAEIRDQNQQEIERKLSEARKSLKTESETLAVNIMEKILDRGVSRG
ncbi:MAG: ATP synthase F0 subunit B [Thermodesulfobacteriota bacterium]